MSDIHEAFFKGDLQEAKTLLESGADPEEKANAFYFHTTPLTYASRYAMWFSHHQYVDLVSMLIHHKASVETLDRQGYSALELAALFNDFYKTEVLLNFKAVPTSQILEQAFYYSDPEIVILLLEAKAEINEAIVSRIGSGAGSVYSSISAKSVIECLKARKFHVSA